MANPTEAAPRDGNYVPAKMAVLNTDTVQGQHLVAIQLNPANSGIMINNTDTISFVMEPIDPKDPNYVNCWLFQGLDGNVYPAVANADGALLIDM